MRTIKIDPKDFIGAPFKTCPKCGFNELGVLGIHGTVTRRCRNCWLTFSEPLPELKKTVIYIDQFAISNIMKLFDPGVKGHQNVLNNPFWRELFEALDVTCHMQIAICPDSEEHEHESLASPFFAALKNTYEYFSGGVSFWRADDIRNYQITELASAWLRNEPPTLSTSTLPVSHMALSTSGGTDSESPLTHLRVIWLKS